jgi:hypothetical protein
VSSVQLPQNEQNVDLGFVYFRGESGSELLREKRRLFGLTARNDSSCAPVERSDVVFFVRKRIEQELRLQAARLRVYDEFQASLAAVSLARNQE